MLNEPKKIPNETVSWRIKITTVAKLKELSQRRGLSVSVIASDILGKALEPVRSIKTAPGKIRISARIDTNTFNALTEISENQSRNMSKLVNDLLTKAVKDGR